MIRRLTLLAVLLTIPGLAAAQTARPRHHGEYGPPSTGVTLSGWLGLGFPTGRAFEGSRDMSDVVNTSIPIGIGAYYRVNPHLRFGGFFEVAPLSIDDSACVSGSDCSGASYRLGVEAQFHASPYQRFDPWVGLGIGYEWLRLHDEYYDPYYDEYVYDTEKLSGLLFPRVSAGVQFTVNPSFTLGPYVTYSAGQYAHWSAGGESTSIHDKEFHGWLELGVRGDFNL